MLKVLNVGNTETG